MYPLTWGVIYVEGCDPALIIFSLGIIVECFDFNHLKKIVQGATSWQFIIIFRQAKLSKVSDSVVFGPDQSYLDLIWLEQNQPDGRIANHE